MNESGDVVMRDVEEARRETPSVVDDTTDTVPMEADTSPALENGHKPLPTSIIPPNKASTAPSQEVIDKYAPGSAPHWIGASAFHTKEVGSIEGGSRILVKT